MVKRHLIVMSDATGGSKYSIYGAAAYLHLTFEDNTSGWILVAACSKLAGDGLTVASFRAVLDVSNVVIPIEMIFPLTLSEIKQQIVLRC